MKELIRKIKDKINYKSIVLFIIAFVIMVIYLYPQPDMISVSGDATSIWATITSYYSAKRIPSYVLYKGFLSVYPYVWCYNFSKLFNVDNFLFIKLYHCILFAYVAAIGFPYTISKLFSKEIKIWRRVILILLLFWIWRFNYALNIMQVDLPSLVIFVLCVNGALKIADKGLKGSKISFIYAGIIIGLCMCLSGQYYLSAICIIIFILLKTISLSIIQDRTLRTSAVISIICLFVGLVPAIAYNSYFEKSVVQPYRNAGVWLPTRADWGKGGLTRLMPWYKMGGGPAIPNNRGLAIIKDFEGGNFDVAYKAQQAGGGVYNFNQLMKMYIKHPVDNITSWSNRLFLGLSTDDGRRSVSHLFIAYTALFLSLLTMKKRCNTMKEFFSPAFFIIFSFIISALAPCVLEIEMRYMLAIQGLIFSIAVLDDILWAGLKEFWNFVKQCLSVKTWVLQFNKPLSYTFIIYFIFIVLCFMHYSALYEIVGSNPNDILYTR